MFIGKLISFDEETQTGKIEQDLNGRIYDFTIEVWDDPDPVKVGEEVEFEVEMRAVVKAHFKPKPVDPDAIAVTKTPEDCINDFFKRENDILSGYNDFVQSHFRIDFLRMRRFLLTAYNDLCAMDHLIQNDRLSMLKTEILMLFKDFEEFIKKAKHAPEYAFEQIFLERQSEYLKVARDLEETQKLLANAKSQVQILSNELDSKERELNALGLSSNRKSHEYLSLEKEVKSLRARYVDLIQFVATRQEYIKKQIERMKKFKDAHFQGFMDTYKPMLKGIKEHFVTLLDCKAYDLDTDLWDRAKQSQIIKKFFRDARIEGGFCSKTFLRYFLRGLDKGKLSEQSKKLFDLLDYLEEVGKKNVLVLRSSLSDAQLCGEIIKQIDSSLNITIDIDPKNALKTLISKPQDIVVMDEEIYGIKAYDFVTQAKKFPYKKPITFCVIVKEIPDYDATQQAKAIGIERFIREHDTDGLFDSVRMVL